MGHWLLCFLFIIHAMVGAVELGTDGWIQNITGAILTPTQGKILFVFTSLMMVLLRVCAHFIETKLGLKPVGLLFVCALLACLGLNLVSAVQTFGPALGALHVYAFGKTFFWPTMLAVTSDRFPRTGAIAISLMGGVGMMSAGLIGGPGLGYAKDRFAAEELAKVDPALAAEWKGTGDPSKFLTFEPVQAIDPVRLEEAKKAAGAKKLVAEGNKDKANIDLAAPLTPEQEKVVAADIVGNRQTLKVDSFIPAAMALCFLLLIYFLVTSTIKPRETDLGMALPSAQPSDQQPDIEPLFIKLDAAGAIYTGTGNSQHILDTDTGDRTLPLLKGQLVMYASAAKAANSKPLVQIWADGGATQQRVIDILNALAGVGINSVTFTDLVDP
jgi:biopolymer transport protein ExbD